VVNVCSVPTFALLELAVVVRVLCGVCRVRQTEVAVFFVASDGPGCRVQQIQTVLARKKRSGERRATFLASVVHSVAVCTMQ
jgi:hypothetical protein